MYPSPQACRTAIDAYSEKGARAAIDAHTEKAAETDDHHVCASCGYEWDQKGAIACPKCGVPLPGVGDGRVPCPKCGRKFNPDRLAKHLKGCHKKGEVSGIRETMTDGVTISVGRYEDFPVLA